jgi:hypothetical protein
VNNTNLEIQVHSKQEKSYCLNTEFSYLRSLKQPSLLKFTFVPNSAPFRELLILQFAPSTGKTISLFIVRYSIKDFTSVRRASASNDICKDPDVSEPKRIHRGAFLISNKLKKTASVF